MLFTGIYAKAMLVFILLFGSLFYFIGSIFYAIHITDIRENENANWQQYKTEHNCRLIESRDKDNNGPAREAWKCDDGAVYWKNQLPG
ncbi:hypothetical protein [Escherichia coli]|uniref:hypothetical protein n=1 Tax=Escherichia coli TaxID=562 RepID=UPI000BE4C4C6|nr:hypothetical protein [Escherichia coli]PJI56570.1 hypothetical protein CTU84_23180 [Escherichia coli]PJI61175.1 hypothetical protein CTY41_23845 [Escherichia coli]